MKNKFNVIWFILIAIFLVVGILALHQFNVIQTGQTKTIYTKIDCNNVNSCITFLKNKYNTLNLSDEDAKQFILCNESGCYEKEILSIERGVVNVKKY